MPSGLDLHAQITADAKVWVRETQRAAQSFNKLANTVQKQSAQTQSALNKLAKFAKGTLAVAIGFSLSRQIMQTAGSLKALGKAAVWGHARVAQMSAVLNMLGQRLGYTAKEMDGFTETIRKKGIEMGVAQNTLQEFIRYEMDLTKSTELARVAQDAAVMSNSNSSATLDKLIYGIARQNSLILRNAGLQVQAGQAIDDYAASINKAASSLTSAERTQAVLNAVLKEGKKIEGAYEKSLTMPLKKLGSLVRVYDDISKAIGKTLYPIMKTFVNNGLDPLVKWISAAVAEGTTFNYFMQDIGKSVSKAMQSFVDFVREGGGRELFLDMANSWANMHAVLIGIAKEFMAVAKSIVSVTTLSAAIKGLTAYFKAIAQIVETLAPLFKALITLKIISMVKGYGAAMALNLKTLYLQKKELITNRVLLTLYGNSATAAAIQTGLLTRATVMLRAAMGAVMPLLLAYVAFEGVTRLVKLFGDEQNNSAEAVKSLNRALFDQHKLVEDTDAVFSSWIDTASRFKTSNQIDDLNDLAVAVGLNRKNLLELLKLGGDDATSRFMDFMVQLGGDHGLTESTKEIINLGVSLGFTLKEIADGQDYLVYHQGKIYEGNIDLITSFGQVAFAWEASSRQGVVAFSTLSDQHARAALSIISHQARLILGDEEFVRIAAESGQLYTDIMQGKIDVGLDWLTIMELLQGRMEGLEQAEIDEAKAAEDARKQDDAWLAKAKKLAGVTKFATEALKAHFIAVVQGEEDYKGLTDSLGEFMRSLEIFPAAFSASIAAANLKNSVLETLTETIEGSTKSAKARNDAVKALPAIMREGIKWAEAETDAVMRNAEAADKTVDATAVFTQKLYEARNEMIRTATEAGYLTSEVKVLADEMYRLKDFSANMQLLVDLTGGSGLKEVESLLTDIFTEAFAGGTQYEAEFTNFLLALQQLLSASIDIADQVDEQVRSLRTADDLYGLIVGKVEDQASAQQDGLRAIFGYINSLEEIKAVDDLINRLLDDRNDLLKEGSGYQLSHELSLLRQQRTLYELERTYERLTQRQDELTPESIEDQQKLVDDLRLAAQKVTAVEEALLKITTKLTKAQAEAGDITAIEAAEIEELIAAEKGAKRQRDAGVVSQIAYLAAQEEVTNAIIAAVAPSDALTEAERVLNDMRSEAELIALDVVIAEKELALARDEEAKTLTTKQAITGELERLDRELLVAAQQQTQAVFDQEAAMMDLARSAPGVETALSKITDQNGLLMTSFGDVVGSIGGLLNYAKAMYPEFETLRIALEHIKLRNMTDEQVDAFVSSIEDAIRQAQDTVGAYDINAIVRAKMGWTNTDLNRYRDSIQSALDGWNLQAMIQLLYPDLADVPEWLRALLDPSLLDALGGKGKGAGTGSTGGGKRTPEGPRGANGFFAGMGPAMTYADVQAEVDRRLAAGTLLESQLSRDASGQILSGTPQDLLIASGVLQEFITDLSGITRRFDDPWFGQVSAGGITNYQAIDYGGFLNDIGAPGTFRAMAKGGIVKKPTMAMIGEAGPEAVIPLRGGNSGLGNTYNINVGAGLSDPSAVAEAVVEALRAYERGNGPVPVTTTASMYTASA